MKKLCSVLLTMLLLLGAAAAESIDLSGLSFADLAALRDRCQLAMMQTDTWQEVEVPQGVYQVGVQIPAGTWTIRCKSGYCVEITWGTKLEENGHDIDMFNSDYYDYDAVYNPEDSYYKPDKNVTYTFTVRDGDYIVIEDAPATFTPGGVTPSFTFK